MAIKQCVVCGKEFNAIGNSKTCSQDHSVSLLRQRWAGKPKAVCVICGAACGFRRNTYCDKHAEEAAAEANRREQRRPGRRARQAELRRIRYASDENYRSKVLLQCSVFRAKKPEKSSIRSRKITDLLTVLRVAMPDLLKEFEL